MKVLRPFFWVLLVVLTTIVLTSSSCSKLGLGGSHLPASGVDMLVFGDAKSEASHGLTADKSEALTGLLSEPARRFLPSTPSSWEGGTTSFKIKVDPEKPNYFTVRLSGDDITENRLMLYVDGKQVGYRHLGEIEQLDYGSWEPGYKGRFFYNTSPLPLELTKGKTEVQCEIRSSGPIWGYGQTWDKYQKPMTEPSRGIYRVYTHTNGCFVPPADEKQGTAPVNPPVRQETEDVIAKLKERVNAEVGARLTSKAPLSQMQMQLLAKAYHVNWTPACEKPETVQQIVRSLDAIYVAYKKNPKLAQADPATWNADWYGLGVSGQVLSLLGPQIAPRLDEQIDDGTGAKLSRRAAYTEMLVACRDWHRLNRRLYTNQSMINDLYGIYLANRGVEVTDPSKALSEPEAKRYLYESVGLEPWRDSDEGGRKSNVGDNYFQLTAKGLTKELGYVGSYGEVLDWMNDIYDATRPAPGQPGDEKIKAQLLKAFTARTIFRYPEVDSDGNRTMRMEQVIGWRDSHYPGYIAYGQRPSRDASALQTAANTLDPYALACAQQMIGDNQFLSSETECMGEKGLRVTTGRLETPGQLELITAQAQTGQRLPMSPDQPDFVWTDEEDGVVALKRGKEIFYASLYWRARHGLNNLARVHYITPQFDRIAVVREETQFTPSGMNYTRPDWTNFGFGNGGIKYPKEIHSAHAAEVLPIAKIPANVPFKPGQESVYAGKGEFYTLRYGPYLIGMNMSKEKTFELKVPEGARGVTELVSKRSNLAAGSVEKIAPRTTEVLFIGNSEDAP